MHRKFTELVFFSAAIALFLGTPQLVRAQVAGATLSGTINDQQGGAIANAKVSAQGDNNGGLFPSPPQGGWPYDVPALTAIHVNNPLPRAWRYLDANIKRNYVYQYNFNIQRQLTASTTLLVGYTGSRALHNPCIIRSRDRSR